MFMNFLKSITGVNMLFWDSVLVGGEKTVYTLVGVGVIGTILAEIAILGIAAVARKILKMKRERKEVLRIEG